MKKLFFLWALLLITTFNSVGQNLTVPDSIIQDLQVRKFEYTQTATFHYKIVYPNNYNKSKKYPVLLGLSGGNASEQIVNYCYYTLFKSNYFDNYITILPMGPSGKTLAGLNKHEIDVLISNINQKENVTQTNWVIAGSSMGGGG